MSIHYIPASEDFLANLHHGICERYSSKDLNKLYIFLPNKASCYELNKVFFNNLHLNQSFLLPNIISLGEISELTFPAALRDNILFQHKLPSPINLEEQILLIFSIIAKKFIHYDIPIRDLLKIASNLAKIILKFRIDNIPLARINEILTQNLFPQISLYNELLLFLAEGWDNYLRNRNIIDEAEYRNLFINELTTNSLLNPNNIIIAGSTGSINSTKKLIKYVVSNGGKLILNTANHLHQAEYWHKLETSHPNFCLKQLLDDLNFPPQNLTLWNSYANNKTLHDSLIDIFTSIDKMPIWFQAKKISKKIELIESDNTNQEALVIAARCKEIIELNPHARIGIILPSNYEGLQIQQYLSLFELGYINTLGLSIVDTDEFKYIKLLYKYVSDKFSLRNLLAILKNKFTYLNFTKQELYKNIEGLEKNYLRRICNYKNLNELIKIISDPKIQELLKRFEEAIILLTQPATTLSRFSSKLTRALELLSNYEGMPSIWLTSKGKKIYEIFNGLIYNKKNNIYYGKANIFYIFISTIQSYKIFYDEEENKKIFITSPIESRLTNFTHIILTDFNRGSWPNIEYNPWLNEQLYKKLELSHEILKECLASYDLLNLLEKKNVIITRSTSKDGSPSSPSKWLERIELFSKATKNCLLTKNYEIIDKIRNIFKNSEETKYYPAIPIPDITLQPKELSVTQIEKLMRDPYSIYAQKILKLKKLVEIDKVPDQADFGNFIHNSIDEFNKNLNLALDFKESLIEIGQKNLEKFLSSPGIRKLWWPRYLQIADWYSNYEFIRRQQNLTILTEIEGYMNFPTTTGYFTLKAKADQLVVSDNKQVTIIDFKTGSIPTNNDIIAGFSPQLTLEGLIGKYKGFIEANNVKTLQYIQFVTNKNFVKIIELKNLDQLLLEAEHGIQKIVELYLCGKVPYLIHPFPEKAPAYNDYKHLERIGEWLI